MATTFPITPVSTTETPLVTPITGIPQSSAPPDMSPGFGKNPWDVEEADYAAKVDEWQRKTIDKIDLSVLAPDEFFKGKDLSFAKDAKKARILATNDAFLSLHADGEEIPVANDLSRKLLRLTLAEKLFEGRGADSEENFHAEIVKQAQGRKDKKGLISDLLSSAALDEAANLDGTKSNGFAEWKKAAMAKPGFNAEDEADLFDAWHETKRAVRDTVNEFRPQLDSVWSAFKADESVNAAARAAYEGISEEKRPAFMAALRLRAQALPAEDQAKFWSNLAKQSGRDFGGLGQDLMDTARINEGFINEAARDARSGGMPDFYPSEIAAKRDRVDQAGKTADVERIKADFAHDVVRIQESTYDPIKYLAKDGTWSQALEKGAYAAPGAVGTSLVAMLPGPAGTAAFFATAREGAYQDYRQKFEAAGMSYTEASRKAGMLSVPAAALEAVAERFAIKAFAGKLPFFEQAMAKATANINSMPARILARTAFGTVEGGLLEQGQGLIYPAMQDIAKGLGMDVSDVKWLNGKDGVLDGYWKDSAGMLVTMLPLGVFGGARGAIHDSARAAAFRDASDAEMLALGMSPDAVQSIREGLKTGVGAASVAIDNGMASLDPTSETAKDATHEIMQAQETQRQAQARLEQLGYAFPKITTRTDGTFAVHDGKTGEEIGVGKSLGDVQRIASAHTTALDDMRAEHVAEMATMLASGHLLAKAQGVETTFDLGKIFTLEEAAAQSPQAAERIAEEVKLIEQAGGGTGAMALHVLGQHSTEVRAGIRQDVNTIFAGGHLGTLLEETIHGKWRAARAAGTVSRADDIALLRAFDQVLGDRREKDIRDSEGNTKRGQSLRFIPEGMADEAISETLIEEAIGQLGQMEIFRTAKGSKNKFQLPRAVVSQHIGAVGQITGQGLAFKFKSFMEAVRARMGLVMSRVSIMKKAERDGTFDRVGYDAYLDKLMGTDVQKAHDDGVRAELNRILALPDIEASKEGPHQGTFGFSIGPAGVAGMMAADALSRIQDPRRRVHAMSRIARDFDWIRMQVERLLHLGGRKRSRYELRAEANAREELAYEEKLGAIHARFGSLLADDDLVKIKAQPVHSYLADPNSPLRGRLMSKTAAIKAYPDRFQIHAAGEYDGSDAVSRSVFGGTRMPDQAAQDLYDEGLISEPTPDAMWEALLSEQKTVAGMKEMLVKAQEDIRHARREAKQEANDWLATQSKDQETNFSPKEEIIRSLRLLDAILLALPAEVRGRIGGYTQMARITTDESRLAFLKDKLAKADKELESFLRVEFDKEFTEIMRKAKPKKDAPGERPTGSIGADAYDVLRAAEAAASLDFTHGEAEADKFDALADNPETDLAEADKYRATAQMIRLTMNWTKADAARREQAVIEADKIYFGGLSALAKENSRRRERLGELRKSALAGTKKTGHRMERESARTDAAKPSKGAKGLAWEFLSFGQVVNVLFGEKSAAARWMNAKEPAAANSYEDGFQAKANAMEAMFESLSGSRFGGEKLRHRMATEKTITVTDALGVEQTFADSEAITYLLMWRQEDGRRHMGGITDEEGNVVSSWAWNEASTAEIEKQLSKEAQTMLAFMAYSYGTEYGRINEVFRKIWNVSMPRHKMYAPITVAPVQGKGDTISDPVSGDTMGVGMTPGSLKNRSNTAVAEPLFKDAFQVFLSHARQMEHFISYAEFSRDALAIINRRESRNAIEAVHPNAATTLSKWIDYFALGGIRDANMGSWWNQKVGGILGRLSQVALVGRVSVLAMQSLQLGAAAYQMPVGAFLTRLARLHLGKLDWKGAFKSEYIQRRIEQMPPVVRDAVMGLASGNPNRAKYYAAELGKTIAGADGLFTSGTYAIFYDYHLMLAKQDKSIADPEQYAHAEAARLTDQVAQPTRAGARSWLEVSNQSNPAFRALWNFSSDPRQKVAMGIYEMMRQDKSGLEKAKGVGKSLAITWAVSGVLQTLLRAIVRDIREPDDDEIFDERHWNPMRLALMAAAGPLGAIPYFGGMLEDSTYAATGQFMPQGGLMDTITRPAKLVPKWMDGEIDALKDAETLFSGAAGASGTAGAFGSFMHVVRDAVGIVDNMIDD